MGQDLGLKALVEFEAKGQREVLDNVGRLSANFESLGGVLRTSLGAAGLTLGLQQVISMVQNAGREVGTWADRFTQSTLQAADTLDMLRTRMRELSGEEERAKIGNELVSKIRTLRRELSDLEFNEGNESWTTALWDGVKNKIAGFDLDASEIRRVAAELKQLEQLQAGLGAQPIRQRKEEPASLEDWLKLDEQVTRAKRESDLADALRTIEDPSLFYGEKTGLIDNIIGNLKTEAEKLEEARAALVTDLQKAVEAGILKDAQRLTADLVQTMGDLNQAKSQIASLEEQRQKMSEVETPQLDINFDRLTRVGATLGDPRSAGVGNLGRGKDPAYYQERANTILAEIRDEMRENRRANYDQAEAFED